MTEKKAGEQTSLFEQLGQDLRPDQKDKLQDLSEFLGEQSAKLQELLIEPYSAAELSARSQQMREEDGSAEDLQRRVVSYLRANPHKAFFEIDEALGLTYGCNNSGTLSTLVKEGRIHRTHSRPKLNPHTGRKCSVYFL